MIGLARERAPLGRTPRRPDDSAGFTRVDGRPPFLAEQRAVAFGSLAILALAYEPLGPNRGLLAALLVFVHLPANLLIERRVPPPHTDRAHVIHDASAALILVALAPVSWVVGLVVAMMVIVASSSTLGARGYLLLSYLFLGLFGAIVAANDLGIDAVFAVAAAGLSVGPIGAYLRWREARIADAARRTDMLIESSSAMFFEIDVATMELVSLRGQVEPILGADPSAFIGVRLKDRFHVDDHDVLDELGDDGRISSTIRYLHPDGKERWLRFFAQTSAVGDALAGERSSIVTGVAIDVTVLERSKQELRHRAETDALTGLRARDLMLERLRDALRFEPERCAVAIVDLDDFKWINDTMGHPAGDALLRAIGTDLGTLEGDDVLVCRLGGDEFGLLIRGDDPRAVAERTARSVLDLLSLPRLIERVDLQLSASIGIAVGWQGATSRDLLRDADIAMYEAKRSRSGFRVFTNRPESLTPSQLSTVAHLTRSLEAEVTLWFQPIIDLATRRIVSVEGLARWDHPEHGILLPASFLPAVERGGMSERLDWLALSAAMAFAERAVAQGTPVEVAVNMTADGLRSDRLIPALQKLLDDGQPLRYLTIEISERDLHDDITALQATLTSLREMGVGLALDDYGTGFSSLIRLRNVPFTQVKIDRSFVSGVVGDRTDQAIVRSTADLATELALVTVAEGVEDDATADLLEHLRCGRAQGFVFGRPRPADDVLAALAHQRATVAAAANN